MSGLIWKQISTVEEPDRRAAHSSVVYRGRMYVFGGWNGLHALDDVVAFHTNDHTWHQVNCLGQPPSQRNNHAVALVGDRMYLHGGHDGVVWLDDLFYLNLETFQWCKPKLKSTDPLPKARACHSLTKIKKKLYLFGGAEGENIFGDLIEFDLIEGSWIELHPKSMTPKPRNSHSACEWDGKLVLFGGHDGTHHLSELFLYEPDKMVWSEIHTSRSIERGMRGHTAAIIGSYLHVFGGYDGKDRLNDLWSVDLESAQREWQLNKAERQPSGRQKHSCVGLEDGSIIVYGGFDGDKWLKDLHVLDLSEYEIDRLEQFVRGSLIYNQASAAANIHRKLFNSKVFSDFEFQFDDGQSIPAHRVVLYSQSQYFENYFFSEMQESESRRMVIHNTSSATFLRLLEFLYSGSLDCRSLPSKTLVDLLQLAEIYFVVGLQKKCEVELIRKLAPQSCIESYLLGLRTGARLLRRHSLNILIRHIKALVITKEYSLLQANAKALAEVTRLVVANSQLNLQYL